jgi:hypothetical protein
MLNAMIGELHGSILGMLRRVKSTKRSEGVNCDAHAREDGRAEEPCRRSLPQVLPHTGLAPATRVPGFATPITMLNAKIADIHKSITRTLKRARGSKRRKELDSEMQHEEGRSKRSLPQVLPYPNPATHPRSSLGFATMITMISAMVGDVHESIVKTMKSARTSKRSKELKYEVQDEDKHSKRSLPQVLPKTSLAPRSRSPPGFATQITMLSAMIGDVHAAIVEMVRKSANGSLNESAKG